MAAKKKLQGGSAALQHLFGVCVNNEAVSRLHGAGGVKGAPVILHQAETAAAVNGKIFAIAERRNVNAVVAGNLEDVALVGKRAFNPVDNHFLFRHGN